MREGFEDTDTIDMVLRTVQSGEPDLIRACIKIDSWEVCPASSAAQAALGQCPEEVNLDQAENRNAVMLKPEH